MFSMERLELISGNASDQGFNLDLERVHTLKSYRPHCCVDNASDGWVLPQAGVVGCGGRQRSLTLLLFPHKV